jgi:hypothetical protein
MMPWHKQNMILIVCAHKRYCLHGLTFTSRPNCETSLEGWLTIASSGSSRSIYLKKQCCFPLISSSVLSFGLLSSSYQHSNYSETIERCRHLLSQELRLLQHRLEPCIAENRVNWCILFTWNSCTTRHFSPSLLINYSRETPSCFSQKKNYSETYFLFCKLI